MLLRAARLHVVSGVRQADIMAPSTSRALPWHAPSRYRERGEDAFFEPRRGRGRTVVDAQMADQAAKLLARDQRQRLRSATRHSGEHLPENRHAGVFAAPAGAARLPSPSRTLRRRLRSPITPPTRTLRRRLRSPITPPTLRTPTRLRLPIVPPATPATSKRPWAARLAMSRAACSPAPADDRGQAGVRRARPRRAHGGVLAALPMLLRAGLLGAANRLFRLPNGFYGLTTILLFVAFMTLARVRNPESLRYQAPGEWGAILGLTAAPRPRPYAARSGCSPAPSTPFAIGSAWHAPGPPSTTRLGDAGWTAT